MLQSKEMDWLNGYFLKGLYICCLQETHSRPEDTERGNGERYLMQREIKRKLEQQNSYLYEFCLIKRDKEGHHIMMKGSTQEDITIVNIYASYIGTPQCTRQMLISIKGETDGNTMIMGSFTFHLHQQIGCPDRKLVSKH